MGGARACLASIGDPTKSPETVWTWLPDDGQAGYVACLMPACLDLDGDPGLEAALAIDDGAFTESHQLDGVSVQYNMRKVLDYWRVVHRRNSYDGNHGWVVSATKTIFGTRLDRSPPGIEVDAARAFRAVGLPRSR